VQVGAHLYCVGIQREVMRLDYPATNADIMQPVQLHRATDERYCYFGLTSYGKNEIYLTCGMH